MTAAARETRPREAYYVVMDTHLESAAVRRVRYDEARCKLFVRFEGGAEYLYVGVPAEVCRSFAASTAKPQFFARRIRDRYPYNKLDG
jgi:lysyl-tRNA synthetase class 2